jgi:hypothetical protein
MFNYNDYNRKGIPKHPDCIYLTNSLMIAKQYGANAVKKRGGFPFIFKVVVNQKNLTWDDDAFYLLFWLFSIQIRPNLFVI